MATVALAGPCCMSHMRIFGKGCLCWMQVTLALYHVLGVLLKREQYLSVTTVGYSAVHFWVGPFPF